jgi:hypothetical protein
MDTWILVLSDGSTWEAVSDAIVLMTVTPEEAALLAAGELPSDIFKGRAALSLSAMLKEACDGE